MRGPDEPTKADMDAHRAFARHYLATTQPTESPQDIAGFATPSEVAEKTYRNSSEVLQRLSGTDGNHHQGGRPVGDVLEELEKLLNCAAAETQMIELKVGCSSPRIVEPCDRLDPKQEHGLQQRALALLGMAHSLASRLSAIKERL